MTSPVSISLQDQLAFVTGGGGGIGRAIALTLASAGADVAVLDIVPERCDEVVQQVQALGRRAIAFPVDAGDADALRAAITQAHAQFGRLDILVNNVGGTSRRKFLEVSERSWQRIINLNLVSLFAATATGAPLIAQGGRGGSIINVTSIEGSRAAPGFAVYAACKAGMNNFTRTMALELAADGIRMNAIAPDYTRTPGTEGNIGGPVDPAKWRTTPQAEADMLARRIPLGRPGIDMECGQAALFLASSMSSYVTGVTLPVDGGSWASSGWFRTEGGGWALAPD